MGFALSSPAAFPHFPPMPPATPPAPAAAIRWLVAAALAALWGQLYLAVVPIWRFGEYYDYGWYVPPLAVFFCHRRWHQVKQAAPAGRSADALWLTTAALAILPLFGLVRALNHVDTGWRPPMLVHAAVVVALSHLLLGRCFGWRVSWHFAPVTVFALSAIPYPWQLEQLLIRRLTGTVVAISSELFNLFGQPVEVVGEQIESMGTVVSVTDGCSGIRSLQNMIMAALFFGEMFLLRVGGRLLLLATGVAAAVVVNTGRAMTLASIRFHRGEQAFHEAHDSVGYLAFAAASLVLLAVAATAYNHQRCQPRSRTVVVRKNA
jgi:exosortase